MANHKSIQILRSSEVDSNNTLYRQTTLLEGQPFYNEQKNYLSIGKKADPDGKLTSVAETPPITVRELVGYEQDVTTYSNGKQLITNNNTPSEQYYVKYIPSTSEYDQNKLVVSSPREVEIKSHYNNSIRLSCYQNDLGNLEAHRGSLTIDTESLNYSPLSDAGITTATISTSATNGFEFKDNGDRPATISALEVDLHQINAAGNNLDLVNTYGNDTLTINYKTQGGKGTNSEEPKQAISKYKFCDGKGNGGLGNISAGNINITNSTSNNAVEINTANNNNIVIKPTKILNENDGVCIEFSKYKTTTQSTYIDNGQIKTIKIQANNITSVSSLGNTPYFTISGSDGNATFEGTVKVNSLSSDDSVSAKTVTADGQITGNRIYCSGGPLLFKGQFARKINDTDKVLIDTDDSLINIKNITASGTITTSSNSGTAISAVNGTIKAQSFNATSDKRLKENIVKYSPNKSILDLPIYSYNFISDEKKTKKIGCLAQDLQEICPEIVKEDDKGYLSIEESKIVYLLLDEIKKLKKRVEELEAR